MLGPCRTYLGKTSWAWWRLGFWAVSFGFCATIVILGVSGFPNRDENFRLGLSAWPGYAIPSIVCGWRFLISLRDVLGPRYQQLRIGEAGLALTVDKLRTDVFWGDVVDVLLSRHWLRAKYIRVTLAPGHRQPPDDDHVDIRTDMMSILSDQVLAEIESCRQRAAASAAADQTDQ